MSIFDRTRYIRAVFVILPFSVLALFFGIKSQFDLPEIKEMLKVDGIYLKTSSVREYNKNYEVYINVYRVYIKGSKKSYAFNKPKDYELFKSSVQKGDNITIWVNTNNSFPAIRQFAKNDKILLKYKRIDVAGLILAGFGLIAFVISVLYIFKHPEDIKGG